jgi:hypothetical protein
MARPLRLFSPLSTDWWRGLFASITHGVVRLGPLAWRMALVEQFGNVAAHSLERNTSAKAERAVGRRLCQLRDALCFRAWLMAGMDSSGERHGGEGHMKKQDVLSAAVPS